MPVTVRIDGLGELLDQQFSVASRGQLLSLGMKDTAVQRGRCTVAELASELSAAPIRGSAMFRSVLAEVAEGIRSAAEADLRDLIRTARLPRPFVQRLTVRRRCIYRPAGCVVAGGWCGCRG
jgi:hypothetical protein